MQLLESEKAVIFRTYAVQMCIFTSLLISKMMSDGNRQSVKHNTH